MLQLTSYDVIIFDCDGVIFDSNKLKIDAMEQTLKNLSNNQKAISDSVDYFRNNFGKSRFHHIDVFISDFFELNESDVESFRENVLYTYSKYCQSLYLQSTITPGVIDLLSCSSDKKLYVASGSEQQELREVFKKRGLEHYFVEILGSPISKAQNIENIIKDTPSMRHVMIGDAVSDFESSTKNNIDFIYFAPLSNVKLKMLELSEVYHFPVINNFLEVLIHD